jgi:hypothetical protein
MEPDRTFPAARTPGRLVSRKKLAARGPVRRLRYRVACLDESLRIQFNLRGQPVGARHRPDEAEQGGRLDRAHFARLVIDALDCVEAGLAQHSRDGGIGKNLDIRGALNPSGKVCRHILVKAPGANEEIHPSGVGGEIDNRLPGGVAPACDDNLGAAAELRLGGCGGVIDAAAFESITILRIKSPIISAGGDQQAFGRRGLVIVKVHHRIGVLERQADDRGSDGHAGPELVGLHHGAPRQVGAAVQDLPK